MNTNSPQRKLHAALLNYINSNNGNARTNARKRLVSAINTVWNRSNGNGGGNGGSEAAVNNTASLAASVGSKNLEALSRTESNASASVANTNLAFLQSKIKNLKGINNLGGAYNNPNAFKNWIKNKQFNSAINARLAYLQYNTPKFSPVKPVPNYVIGPPPPPPSENLLSKLNTARRQSISNNQNQFVRNTNNVPYKSITEMNKGNGMSTFIYTSRPNRNSRRFVKGNGNMYYPISGNGGEKNPHIWNKNSQNFQPLKVNTPPVQSL